MFNQQESGLNCPQGERALYAVFFFMGRRVSFVCMENGEPGDVMGAMFCSSGNLTVCSWP